MLNKKQILDALNDESNFVDEFILDAFIKNLKIEAIYEDENGVEFYDEASFEKIKNALGAKNKKPELYTVEEIKKEETLDAISLESAEEIQNEKSQTEELQHQIISSESETLSVPDKKLSDSELKNFTLDITNQTLSMLAESIAQKITVDISSYLKKNEWLEEAVNAGEFKKDNEILSLKLQELLEDNKILVKRIQELEKENQSYMNVFANIYVKKLK